MKPKTNNTHFSLSDALLLRHLGAYIRPQVLLLLLAAIFLLGTIALDLYRPIILKHVIDTAIPQHSMGLVIQLAGIYFLTICGSILAMAVQKYTLELFGQRIIYQIRNSVMYKIISRSVTSFNALPVGNLVTRVTNDTEALRTLYSDVLLKLASSILLIVGMLLSMYYLNVSLAIVVTFLIPLMATIIFIYQKYARQAFRGVRTKLAASNTAVQEMLNFIVIIKTYVGEINMEKQYDGISKEFLKAGLFEVKTFAIFRPIVDGLMFVVIIAIFLFTNWFSSVTDAGTVFAFLQYVNKLFQPLKDIADKYNSLQSALAGAERLVPLLQEKEEIDVRPVSIPPEWLPLETITFDHVWFSYDNDDTYAVQDVTFTIHKGDFIGIAGPSGGGKSTLMSLLMGFYRPTKGRILINGHDTAAYEVTALREYIGYVFQDSHLFKGSILDNLSLHDETVPQQVIESAAKQAHLHEMITQLPQGYDTPVGYLGSLLSSGQKQLLGMARALVQEKPLLIFDEATANIDSYTEQLIQESIGAIRGDKTIISIAHRLSTIQDATRIYVINDGRIQEEGTWKELMEQGDKFATLWQTQIMMPITE